jgi:hypothetical protein
MDIETRDGALVLPPVLDLTVAEPLHRALLALPPGRPVVVHGAAVEQASTPCLQVLLAAARGAPFELHEPSAALRAAIGDLGLTSGLCGETP